MDRKRTLSGSLLVLLKKGKHGVSGRNMYGIGNQLVSVDSRTAGKYNIRTHDISIGAVKDTLLTIDRADVGGLNFFAGDDALYWPSHNKNARQLSVLRYPLKGTPQPIITRALTSTKLGASIAIDESSGKVLLVYMDGVPASNGVVHFNLYDRGSGVLEDLDIDPSFYAQTIFSTQFFVFE